MAEKEMYCADNRGHYRLTPGRKYTVETKLRHIAPDTYLECAYLLTDDDGNRTEIVSWDMTACMVGKDSWREMKMRELGIE